VDGEERRGERLLCTVNDGPTGNKRHDIIPAQTQEKQIVAQDEFFSLKVGWILENPGFVFFSCNG
jgi:hypothetical protein